MYTSRSPRQPVLESCCNDGIKVAFVTRPLDGYTATRRYWRLQEPCLPTLLPMYHCSAIVVYGYATYLGGSIVWKYPTAVPYVQALLNMTNRRQLSHRNNNITVYFTLGGEREDSRNLSFVAGHPVIRQYLIYSVHTSRSPRQPVLQFCCYDGIKVAFVTRPLDGYTAIRRHWRLQEPYLPPLLLMYYCSAIVVYGYATYLDGSIVWKYPTAVPYLQALLNMTNRHQLLHRNNNITVYFTLGGERQDR
ncbi:hypothetical protein HPB51_000363 [Rhipicephalus microplus]|uniref:Uncharacterized protein n=1 Tax=Rhipicephalus microplus TaxID=6941 RepID=A0A9J6EKP7_RHIMP|nr:hypothetical protein HPB51_000363 [Rhipicephalus microplus]